MAQKFGEAFFHDMIDRGRRELGGLMFEGSPAAQPMYPLRGTYGPPKELDGPESSTLEPSHKELSAELSREDTGRDDRDLGMERE